MSHEQQIIKALKSAVGDYKLAIAQKDKAIKLQKEAIHRLRTIVAHLIPHTNYTEEEKDKLYTSMGLDTKPKLEVVKNAS